MGDSGMAGGPFAQPFYPRVLLARCHVPGRGCGAVPLIQHNHSNAVTLQVLPLHDLLPCAFDHSVGHAHLAFEPNYSLVLVLGEGTVILRSIARNQLIGPPRRALTPPSP